MMAISSSVWLPMKRLEQRDHLRREVCATVISQALTIAAATRNMITAVVLAAVTNTSYSCAQLHLAVDHGGDEQRVHRRHHGRLGGREDAELQADQHDHRQHQRPGRFAQRRPALGRRWPSAAACTCLALRATHHQVTRDRHAHQQARHDAGQEQLADRHVGGDAEDHEADRRRDDRRDDAGRRRSARRQRALSWPALAPSSAAAARPAPRCRPPPSPTAPPSGSAARMVT